MSLYELSRLVAADLRTRKYPNPVSYAPERAQRKGFHAGVVFERDRPRGDGIGPPIASHPEAGVAKPPFSHVVAGAFVVYARSPKPGANSYDHEDECDAVCHGVITALYRICKANRLPLAFESSRLLAPEEVDGPEGKPLEATAGAAARVEFTVTTPVRDVDYKGRGPLVGEPIDDVQTTYEAELVAAPESP